MLDTFAMQQGGTQYRRLAGAFQRIFGATTFFGADLQRERAAVVHRERGEAASPRESRHLSRRSSCFPAALYPPLRDASVTDPGFLWQYRTIHLLIKADILINY